MSALKKLASDSAIYGLNSILGRAVNFLLVPLHTRAFEKPADMAVIVMLYSLVTFLNIVYTYGMETAYFRYVNSPEVDSRKVYNTVQSALLISSLLFSGLIILLAGPIMGFLGFAGYEHLLVLMAVIVALDAIVAIPFARLRHERQAKRYVAIRLASILLNVGLNVLLLYYAKNLAEGGGKDSIAIFVRSWYSPNHAVGYIVLANLLANAIYIPLLWPQLVAKFSLVIDKTLLLKMWHYGYPLLILGLAGMVNQQIDRGMLLAYLPENFYKGFTTNAAVSIYGNCYKLAVLISLATQSFRFAADPFFFSKAEDKKAPELFAKVSKWFTIVCCTIALVICLNIDLLGKIIGENYRIGLGIVPFIVMGNVFLGLYYNVAVWFKLTDRTLYGTYITLLGAAINVALNYVLIPQLGFMGCAWAFIISCFAMLAACYVLGNRYFPVPYQLAKILGYMLLTVLLIILNSLLPQYSLLPALAIHGTMLLGYMAVVYGLERKQGKTT
jgi:O-antigen/teichoic acid export membrane protein